MENLAERITIFLAAHNYIAEDKKDWCHYVVIKFLMSALSLCFLIPIGSLVVGWIGSILYTFTFRFLRARTGGYHAKTPHGCLITSVILQILFLSLSICMPDASLFIFVAIISGLSIALIGPVNHPELHLSSAEMSALRPRILFACCLYFNSVFPHPFCKSYLGGMYRFFYFFGCAIAGIFRIWIWRAIILLYEVYHFKGGLFNGKERICYSQNWSAGP